MLRTILCFSGCLTLGTAFAQEVQTNEEPKIGEMMQLWITSNRNHPYTAGWRVQILSSTDRQQTETAKARFLSSFPTTPALWVHERPYYKLRVGACKTRMEALALIADLKDYYPGAYPAQDMQILSSSFLK